MSPSSFAQAVRKFLAAAGVETLYVEPGSPWQSGYAESFHSRLRSELLDAEVFETVAEAQSLSAAWKNDYNHRRPHSSLGYQTPAALRPGVLLPLRLRFSSTPGKKKRKPYQYHYPNLYSHNPWYNIWGHSSCPPALHRMIIRVTKLLDERIEADFRKQFVQLSIEYMAFRLRQLGRDNSHLLSAFLRRHRLPCH